MKENSIFKKMYLEGVQTMLFGRVIYNEQHEQKNMIGVRGCEQKGQLEDRSAEFGVRMRIRSEM